MERATTMVTVSGLPGSGTTTVCALLSATLGWEHVNAGEVFRQLARASGLTLAEMGRRAEADGDIDRQLDARMVDAALRLGRVVLEGRLAGWMALRHDLPALRVWLSAPPEVRAARVSRRDLQAMAEALAAMRQREASEARRYRLYHQIDIADLSLYGLVVDTASTAAQQVADRVVQELAGRTREGQR